MNDRIIGVSSFFGLHARSLVSVLTPSSCDVSVKMRSNSFWMSLSSGVYTLLAETET